MQVQAHAKAAFPAQHPNTVAATVTRGLAPTPSSTRSWTPCASPRSAWRSLRPRSTGGSRCSSGIRTSSRAGIWVSSPKPSRSMRTSMPRSFRSRATTSTYSATTSTQSSYCSRPCGVCGRHQPCCCGRRPRCLGQACTHSHASQWRNSVRDSACLPAPATRSPSGSKVARTSNFTSMRSPFSSWHSVSPPSSRTDRRQRSCGSARLCSSRKIWVSP